MRDDFDPGAVAQIVREWMSAKNFVIQLEDKLISAPVSSVRTIEVSPSLSHLFKTQEIKVALIDGRWQSRR